MERTLSSAFELIDLANRSRDLGVRNRGAALERRVDAIARLIADGDTTAARIAVLDLVDRELELIAVLAEFGRADPLAGWTP